jgi:hypothetical protein
MTLAVWRRAGCCWTAEAATGRGDACGIADAGRTQFNVGLVALSRQTTGGRQIGRTKHVALDDLAAREDQD